MSLLAKLRKHKTLRISGIKFTIRKINPLLDFPPDKTPQIFTSFRSRRPDKEDHKLSDVELKKTLEDAMNMIRAGVVSPEIGKDIKIEDIMADNEMSYRLYVEILIHSLNQFSGIKGLFFSIKLKRYMFTLWRKNMEKCQSKYYTQTEDIQ